MIRYQKDTNNIVTLTFDMEGTRSNVINHQMWTSFLPVLQRLQLEKEKGRLRGVIFTSAKRTFLSGGGLDSLLQVDNPEEIYSTAERMKLFLRELERPGVPVVAAINGSALGPGFEMALACHHRVALNKPEIRLGFPEINFGLTPGAGGIIRLLWLKGIAATYSILSSGRPYPPGEALQIGLIDELARDQKEMMEKAKQWLFSKPDGRRPWDQPDAGIPFGDSRTPDLASFLQLQLAQLRKDNHPQQKALETILLVLEKGAKVDFDTASRLESRYYAFNLSRPQTRNLIQALYFDRHILFEGPNRPKGYGRFRPKRVGIIGAGRMGSGIALACLRHQMQVVLKDISALVAERGRDFVRNKLNEDKEKGVLDEQQESAMLSQITTTEQSSDFAQCDVIIEAVFEHPGVKRKVTREAEEFLDEFSLFATNTISIPITELAEGTQHPQQYIGLHFFHPADQVPLVEIVRGQHTSEETVARSFDFVMQIGKVPIIVKDDWGFFAARVQNTYLLEGITMLQEGVPAPLIEYAGRLSGLPEGPLRMADRLGLDLALKYENQAAAHYGKNYIQHPAVSVLTCLLEEYERKGISKRAGFYEYDELGAPQRLWAELSSIYKVKNGHYSTAELTDRMLIAQALEAVWCLQEGVIRLAPEANLGSIYGWGFPADKGGVIQYIINQGKEEFMAKCQVLQNQFGPRFRVPRKIWKIIGRNAEQIA